jgi:hypothetical protein
MWHDSSPTRHDGDDVFLIGKQPLAFHVGCFLRLRTIWVRLPLLRKPTAASCLLTTFFGTAADLPAAAPAGIWIN